MSFGGGFAPRALGEVAIRCRNLPTMERFYGEVLGLPLLARRPGGITFFRVAQGFGGHVAVVALFEDAAHGPGPGALHHLALTVTPHDQARAADWFRRLGIACRFEEFPWIGWRGLFLSDPEGNVVELVAAVAPPAAA